MTQTRRCSTCRERKTIRGVWYVVPPREGAPDFVCESCMARAAPAATA